LEIGGVWVGLEDDSPVDGGRTASAAASIGAVVGVRRSRLGIRDDSRPDRWGLARAVEMVSSRLDADGSRQISSLSGAISSGSSTSGNGRVANVRAMVVCGGRTAGRAARTIAPVGPVDVALGAGRVASGSGRFVLGSTSPAVTGGRGSARRSGGVPASAPVDRST
jgi:hypothetical protein